MPPEQSLRLGPLPTLLGYRLRLAQQALFRDFGESVRGVLHALEAQGLIERRVASRLTADERGQLLMLLEKLSGK